MSAGHCVLVVEDDDVLQEQLAWSLEDYKLLQAANREDALNLAVKHKPQVVLLDLGLPPDPVGVDEGFATLDSLLEINNRAKVIVLTGRDSRNHARSAIERGAHDFCAKPMESSLIRFAIDRAMHVSGLEADVRRQHVANATGLLPGLVGASPAVQRLSKIVTRISPTNLSVLLEGESGTGKELVARALHSFSERRQGRFVAINCAAIPENLLESELFGYERGAFTGANKTTPGKVELADGGTLFLDEVGDMPLGLQGKLLRFLQERVIERVGGRSEIKVDTRIVCATHRDLNELIENGKFRQDVYFRLAGITVELPSLRERHGDTVLLAKHFMQLYSKELSKNITGYTSAALDAIDRYQWPGNIREMQNRVKRAVVLADAKTIDCEDLDLKSDGEPNRDLDLRKARQAVESETIRRALATAEGNISQTAKLLGVSRPTLYDLMRELGLRD